MSACPPVAAPAEPPGWDEVPSPSPNCRGYVRVAFRRIDPQPVQLQAIVVDLESLRYRSEIRGVGLIRLEATDVVGLARMLDIVDAPTRTMLRTAWLWRCQRQVELALEDIADARTPLSARPVHGRMALESRRG